MWLLQTISLSADGTETPFSEFMKHKTAKLYDNPVTVLYHRFWPLDIQSHLNAFFSFNSIHHIPWHFLCLGIEKMKLPYYRYFVTVCCQQFCCRCRGFCVNDLLRVSGGRSTCNKDLRLKRATHKGVHTQYKAGIEPLMTKRKNFLYCLLPRSTFCFVFTYGQISTWIVKSVFC